MPPLRIGLIGASRVATYAVIAPARDEPRADVVAVAARDMARAEGYAQTHGIARAYGDYRALLDDPGIDLVYIGTPSSEHRALVLAALAAGKPVLCEKPFAMNAGQATEMLDAAAAAGLPLFEAMHSRHHALWRRLHAIIDGGAIGTLRHIDGRFDIALPWSADEFRWNAALGGGALMDLGIYPLAWARALTRAEPEVTGARMEMRHGVDAAVEAELAFPGGVTARIRASMIAPDRAMYMTVTGSNGVIEVVNPLAPQLGHSISVSGRPETVDAPPTFAAQLSALCASMLDGAAWPLVADDPVRSMRAIDAVARAAAS
jgi:predicted dehydrogenase